MGLLWFTTARCGTETVRKHHVRERRLDVPGGIADISHDRSAQTKPPWFYCRAHAVAPLIVGVDYARVVGPLDVSGGRTYYFWFFGAVFVLKETISWDS